MLVSTGLLVQSVMAAGLVADAYTETLRTGWLARERERARSTGNGLTYLARDKVPTRFCRIEGVSRTHTYALDGMLNHDSAKRRTAIAGYSCSFHRRAAGVQEGDGAEQQHPSGAHSPGEAAGGATPREPASYCGTAGQFTPDRVGVGQVTDRR